MNRTAFQDRDVAVGYLDHRRAAIPYATDQTGMLLHLVRHFRPEPALFLDLGCGDGFLARTLLRVYPEARGILVDNSEPMLERACIEMLPFGEQCEIHAADLGAPISSLAAPGSADLVVSGYAIHHLPHPRKRALYAEIYELLAPGGVFVNVEHVASASPELEALFEEQYIDRLAARSDRPRERVAHDYRTRPDKADNKLELLETQLRWLREIGFRHVDCPFKWLELAVLCGVR